MKSQASKHLKSVLLTGVCASCLLIGPAVADESAAPEQGSLEEIVIKGTKLQNLRSLEAKRDMLQVIDAISADEIGRLPDFNVGESLARVPGVSIRTDQGEARFVSIRGLNPNYNSTLLDGSTMAVPDRAGRKVFMEVLPASVSKRIEVFKTATPDLEGHAVGGIINLVTPKAYDYDDMALQFQGEIGRYDQYDGYQGKRLSGNADFLFADKFGSNGEFGVVVTGNYFSRYSYLPWVQFERFRFYNPSGVQTSDYADGSVGAPGQRRYHWYKNDRTRYGGMVKLEHKPSTDIYSFLKVYYNIASDDEARQTDVLNNLSGNTLTNFTPTSGTLIGTGFQSLQQLGLFEFERSVWGGQVGTDYNVSENTLLKLRGSYSGSLFKNPESFFIWRRNSSDYAFSYDRDGDAFNVTLNNPTAAYNLNNLPMIEWNLTDRRMKEQVYEASADIVGDQLFGSDALGYIIGAKYRRTDRNFDENRQVYTALAGNTLNLGASGLASLSSVSHMPGILSGQQIIVIDSKRTLSTVQDHIAANVGQWSFNDQPDVDARSDYGVQEDVIAGYAAVTHQSDRHRMVAGLRIEATSYDTSGFRRNPALPGPANYVPITDRGHYVDFLPSFNYSYDISDDMVVRAAYSKTIGRPPFNQFAPSQESVTIGGTQPTVTRSNPDLKPRKSDNIDLSIEKYLDNGTGIIALGAFYKRIQGEIILTTTEQLVDIFGTEQLALVTQPSNAGKNINLWGLELNIIKNFDFLPSPLDGLGASFNATKLWHDFEYQTNTGVFFDPITMQGQSNKMFNASLFYDKGPFSAKLAYNYIGIQMDVINTNPDQISYVDREWHVDFKASYRVTESLSASINLFNILGEREDLVTGRFQEQPGRESNFGPAYFFGLSYVY